MEFRLTVAAQDPKHTQEASANLSFRFHHRHSADTFFNVFFSMLNDNHMFDWMRLQTCKKRSAKREQLQNPSFAQILNLVFGYIYASFAKWFISFFLQCRTANEPWLNQPNTDRNSFLLLWVEGDGCHMWLVWLFCEPSKFVRCLFRTRQYFRLLIGVLNPISLTFHANLTA